MKGEQVAKISVKLNSLLEFLQPLISLINCHMVNFITDRLWEELPDILQSELFSMKKETVYEMLWNRENSTTEFKNISEVEKFLSKCSEMSLTSDNFKDVVEPFQRLQSKLDSLKAPLKRSLLSCSPHCMSEKKTHEVEIFGGIVTAVAAASNASYVVDVGGGKGYLGTILTLHQNLQVISVDSSEQNTNGVLKLSSKIEKFQKRGKDKHWEKVSFTKHTCKGVTAYISPQTNLSLLIEEHFPMDGSSKQQSPSVSPATAKEMNRKHPICLAGLHTCGNLSSSSLQLFCLNSDITSLCNVGCCYNLLGEKFSDGVEGLPRPEGETNQGFPMSRLLLQKRTALGRNARMLAAQALHRISDKKLIMPDSLFYRAALQVCLERALGPNSNLKVGRMGSKVQDLKEYLSKSQEKLKIDLQLSEDCVLKLFNHTSQYRNCMEIFYIMRLALAPVVEAVILLDRLLFLCEQGVDNVFLAQLFDPIISPRCFGIIALK